MPCIFSFLHVREPDRQRRIRLILMFRKTSYQIDLLKFDRLIILPILQSTLGAFARREYLWIHISILISYLIMHIFALDFLRGNYVVCSLFWMLNVQLHNLLTHSAIYPEGFCWTWIVDNSYIDFNFLRCSCSDYYVHYSYLFYCKCLPIFIWILNFLLYD